jgi:hypothetical protein
MAFTNNPDYVSNSIPIGSVLETLGNGTNYVFENLTINRPTKVIQRVDNMGRDNGWALVKGQPCTATAVLQVPSVAAIPALGVSFTDTLTGTTSEKWVITAVDQPVSHDTYFKVNVSLKLDYVTYPPTY